MNIVLNFHDLYIIGMAYTMGYAQAEADHEIHKRTLLWWTIVTISSLLWPLLWTIIFGVKLWMEIRKYL